MPAKAPELQKMRECFSSLILIQKMVKAAAVIPQDWIIRLKSRATEGAIPDRVVNSRPEMRSLLCHKDTAQGAFLAFRCVFMA